MDDIMAFQNYKPKVKVLTLVVSLAIILALFWNTSFQEVGRHDTQNMSSLAVEELVFDLECCRHVEDVATRSAPSECATSLLQTKPMSALGPSGECKVITTIIGASQGPIRLTAVGSQTAIYVDLKIEVLGPTPLCDGSFITFHVFDISHGEMYQYAWHYWNGQLNITSTAEALRAPLDPNGRSIQKRIILPKAGDYSLEVLYKQEMYTGMLDTTEGANLKAPMSEAIPVMTTKKLWLSVNDSCFSTRQERTSLNTGCQCDEKQAAEYTMPGFWRKHRQEFVPFYYAHKWNLKEEAHRVLREFQDHFHGGLLIIGGSRPRTQYFDLANMLGVPVHAYKAHDHISHHLPGGFKLSFMWHEISHAFETDSKRLLVLLSKFLSSFETDTKYGSLPSRATKLKPEIKRAIDTAGMCNAKSLPGIIVIVVGSGVISRTLPPDGLERGVVFVKDELSYLKEMCEGTNTTVIVGSEMALFDMWPPKWGNGNSFRDNRNVAFNEAVREISRDLHLSFIDNYGLSLSAGRSDWASDHAHYYSETGGYLGDEVSKTCAKIIIHAARQISAKQKLE